MKHTRTFNTFVMVRIDTNIFLFVLSGKWILTMVKGLELVVCLEIGPPPYTTIYDMRQAFAMRHLNEKKQV